MLEDSRLQQARTAHRDSIEFTANADRRRAARDKRIREVRAADPKKWSYAAIAKAVGCSPELVAYIVKNP